MRLLAALTLLAGCPLPGAAPQASLVPHASPAPERALRTQPMISSAPAIADADLDTPHQSTGGQKIVLDGDRSALDLKSLTRTTLDYTLTMDTAPLATLDARGKQALLLHLASDPRWRVYEEGEVLVAARRALGAEGNWTVPGSGYHPSETGPWRVLLRFGAWPASHPWARSEFVEHAPADAGVAQVGGFVPQNSVWEGQVITALAIEGPEVSLDVYESGPQDGRERTAAALTEVPSVVHNARILSDRIHRSGHDALLLPPGEPATEPPELELTSPGRGELEWRARVNAGEPGWVWLRLVDRRGAWEEAAVTAGTREAVGYSVKPERTFYAQGRFTVPRGEAFDGEAEIWFRPEDGDARRLSTIPLQVPAR